MPLNFGDEFDEATLRGQNSRPMPSQPRANPADLAARDAAARAGNGSYSFLDANGVRQTLTGDQFRTSTDPMVVADRTRMMAQPYSDPNLLFGSESGREMSQQERDYRRAHSNFMQNPNSGVDASEAARAVAIAAAIALGGSALLGPSSAGAGAGAGASAVGTSTVAPTTATNLGIFANNGVGGLASVGGGNAGALAASGGISGGAGTASAGGGMGWLAKLGKGLGSSFQQQSQQQQMAPPPQTPPSMMGPPLEEDPTVAMLMQLMKSPTSSGLKF